MGYNSHKKMVDFYPMPISSRCSEYDVQFIIKSPAKLPNGKLSSITFYFINMLWKHS